MNEFDPDAKIGEIQKSQTLRLLDVFLFAPLEVRLIVRGLIEVGSPELAPYIVIRRLITQMDHSQVFYLSPL